MGRLERTHGAIDLLEEREEGPPSHGIAMILLDTHVLLWLAVKPARLSKAATRAIKRAERAGGVAISSITLWEITPIPSG